MREYPKIYGPYQRDTTPGPNRNKVIHGAWTHPEFEALADTPWVWTEKVDGTNIRVHWDGHRVQFGGRTAMAQIPAKLITVLRDLFPEQLFEQQFGSNVATLFGEGYGAGIQKGGGNYRADAGFTLFDVLVGGEDRSIWLLRDKVVEVANQMGVDFVPQVYVGSVHSAISIVGRSLTSQWGAFLAEGVVGTPTTGLLDRRGNRIMMKVKAADYGPPPVTPT